MHDPVKEAINTAGGKIVRYRRGLNVRRTEETVGGLKKEKKLPLGFCMV